MQRMGFESCVCQWKQKQKAKKQRHKKSFFSFLYGFTLTGSFFSLELDVTLIFGFHTSIQVGIAESKSERFKRKVLESTFIFSWIEKVDALQFQYAKEKGAIFSFL